MRDPTEEEVRLRAEKLASEAGLDWVTMFRRADERGDRATAGDGQKEELLDLARQHLLDERTRKPKDT